MIDLKIAIAIGVALLIVSFVLMSFVISLCYKLAKALKTPKVPVCFTLNNDPAMVIEDNTAATAITIGSCPNLCYDECNKCNDCNECTECTECTECNECTECTECYDTCNECYDPCNPCTPCNECYDTCNDCNSYAYFDPQPLCYCDVNEGL